jgi:hypothetical protein
MLTSCWRSRTPCIYELPEGFRGWTLVEFEVDGAPALPQRDGKLLFSFPASGRLVTSSRFKEGLAKDEFYFVGQKRSPLSVSIGGSDGMIWAQVTGATGTGNVSSRTFQRFFVGSRQEFEAAANAAPIPK